jgi:hypothetical protein
MKTMRVLQKAGRHKSHNKIEPCRPFRDTHQTVDGYYVLLHSSDSLASITGTLGVQEFRQRASCSLGKHTRKYCIHTSNHVILCQLIIKFQCALANRIQVIYKKIIIAVDSSAYSPAATKKGIALVNQLNARPALVFVIDKARTIHSIDTGIDPDEAIVVLKKEAEETLDQRCKIV